jgi:diguanylate cyclase (GGDEF)-like protein
VNEKAANFQEKFQALRENYVAGLNEKLAQIEDLWKDLAREQWEQERVETLHRYAHSLIGSGSTFGFHEISSAARALDNELKALLEKQALPDKTACENIATKLATLKTAAAEPKLESTETVLESDSRSDAEQASSDAPLPVLYVSANPAGGKALATQLGQFGYKVTHFANETSDNATDVPTRIADVLERDINSNAASTNVNNDSILAIIDTADTPLDTFQIAAYELSRRNIPMVFVNGSGSLAARLQAVRMGAQAYLTDTSDAATLTDTLDRMALLKRRQAYRVLIVEDTVEMAQSYAIFLQQADMVTETVTDPLKTLDAIVEFNPELVLMDMYMPHCSGRELAAVIRQQDAYASLPIVFLSGESDIQTQLAAMSLGGDDFLTKPITPAHLVAAVSIRAERYRKLRSLVEKDSLTGLLNHTKIEERLNIEIARAQRNHTRLTYAILDIDHFKSVNDTYGHVVGDKVIKSLAHLLQQTLRKTDVIGRYGGEEFVVILDNTDATTGVAVMDKIRKKFATLEHCVGATRFKTTFSCGVAEYPQFLERDILHEAADKALYRAKNAGRNRVLPTQA